MCGGDNIFRRWFAFNNRCCCHLWKKGISQAKNRNTLTDKSIAFHFSHETHGIKKRFIVLVLKMRYKDYIWCMSFTLQIAHRLFSKTHAFSLLKSTPTKFFKYLLNNPGAKILINTKYFEELKRCNVVGFRQLRSKPLRSACIRGRLSAGENVDLLNSVLLLSCTILDCFHEVPGERWFRKTAAANQKKVK